MAAMLACMLTVTAFVPAAGAATAGPAAGKDVPASHWAAKPLQRWMELGVIRGYEDGSIRPNQAMTRAQFAAVMNATFQFEAVSDADAADLPESAWYTAEMRKAIASGYLKLNADMEALPNRLLSRAEAAVALQAIFGFASNSSAAKPAYKDLAALDAGTAEAIRILAQGGYIQGYPNGTFKPEQTMTRAELIVLLDRLVSLLARTPGDLAGGTVKGNVVVNADGVVLKDTVIEGSLYLAPGIGDGDATLRGVTVRGSTHINGGGPNSVGIIDSTLMDVQVDKQGEGGVRVYASGNTTIGDVTVGSNAKLEETGLSSGAGGFGKVQTAETTNDGNAVQLELDGSFEEVRLNGKAAVKLADTAVIEKLHAGAAAQGTTIEGKGKINQSTIEAEGVKHNGSTLPKGSSVVTPPASNPSTGGGGGNTQPMWSLVWQDEFTGSEVDTSKWGFEIGNGSGGWGNNEKQYYKQENATIAEGNLVITAKEETVEGFNYTSSRMLTRGKFAKKYGKIEARIKLPEGSGLWPAFWMMPEDSVYGGWPASGEIDIMEARGYQPHAVHGTIHYGGNGHKYSGGEYVFPEGQSISQYHTYAIEWEPNEIRWYVDGELFSTKTNWDSTTPGQPAKNAYPAPFDQDFYLILNMAVGGHYVENTMPEPGDVPAEMLVDYVRVYELTGRGYAEATAEPTFEVEPLPAGAKTPIDGSYIYDPGYAQGFTEVNADGEENLETWNLTTIDQFAGSATATVETLDGKPFVKIGAIETGTQPYAVQLIQHLPVGIGRYYKVSFDAKAESDRIITAQVGGDHLNGWPKYSDAYTANLTAAITHHEFVFRMEAETYARARIEFNLAQSNVPLWLGNVRIEEVDPVDPYKESDPKAPRYNNHVYNGTFDLGRIDRMTYWFFETEGASASASVDPAARQLAVAIADGQQGASGEAIKLKQQGITLVSDNDYRLTFDAKAAAERSIGVRLLSKDGSVVYGEASIALTTDMGAREASFTMNAVTDKEAQIVFLLGGHGADVTLDNIVLAQTTEQSEEPWLAVGGNMLANGEFDSDTTGWLSYYADFAGVAGTATAEAGELKVEMNSNGSDFWHVQFDQEKLTLEQGKSYRLDFDARATVPRTIQSIVEHKGEPYTKYLWEDIALTEEMKHHSYVFTMEHPNDEAVHVNFAMGKIDEPITVTHAVYMDNIRLTELRKPSQIDVVSNVLTNGGFDANSDGWLSFFADFNGIVGTTAVENGELKVSTNMTGSQNWNIQVDQENLTVEQGKSYKVSFRARSSVPRNIELIVEHKGEPFTKHLLQEVALTDKMKSYHYVFTMTNATDAGAHLNFALGNVGGPVNEAHDVYLDDIVFGEADIVLEAPEPVEGHALLNGTFDTDTNGWALATNDGSNATVAAVGGELKADFTTYDGWQQWSTIVSQNGLKLTTGKTYVLSFEARSTLAKSVLVEVNRGGGGFHLTAQPVNLTTSMQTLTHEFTVTGDTDQDGRVSFLLGSQNVEGENFTAHSIFVDNVTLTEKAE
jgi:beta-glucanase (GH16 family)